MLATKEVQPNVEGINSRNAELSFRVEELSKENVALKSRNDLLEQNALHAKVQECRHQVR